LLQRRGHLRFRARLDLSTKVLLVYRAGGSLTTSTRTNIGMCNPILSGEYK
jgi:hypothetical protein